MISNEHIFMQIDKQLVLAKTTGNENTKREALAAIRALCDLALESVPSSSPQAPSVVQTVPIAPTIQQPVALKEDDANGESLFDF
ncbi:YwdI family protein [Psychrobacillus sp. NPDC096426]|uniref:YwdI family protein n=1 Tax=Psychrobacillus sp. NPDC096426 TaxID=3364491 RepID=UPI0038267514